ncbi:hypothetical protein ACIHFE_04340 [Streptomyces sp. NPDC052396]|uniref:hypothetical protein n=1 Tax=Streptomyces sp. NPDC052396 TaxID=3365689 RepID=UPI0037D3816E
MGAAVGGDASLPPRRVSGAGRPGLVAQFPAPLTGRRSSLAAAALALGAFGCAGMIWSVTEVTLMQQRSPVETIGRISSASRILARRHCCRVPRQGRGEPRDQPQLTRGRNDPPDRWSAGLGARRGR